MSDDDAKKNEERRVLDAALADLNLVATVEGREAPDFVLTLQDGRRVTVEVRRLVTAHIAAGQAALRRLRAEVERRLAAQGLALDVHFLAFAQTTGLLGEPAVFRAHVDAIMDLVALGPGEYEDELDTKRAHAIRWVVIHPHEDPKVARVSMSTMGEGQHPRLAEIVASKDAKLTAYKLAVPDASEHWLLLTADGDVASAVERSHAADAALETAFDRVIFHDGFRESKHPMGLPATFDLRVRKPADKTDETFVQRPGK